MVNIKFESYGALRERYRGSEDGGSRRNVRLGIDGGPEPGWTTLIPACITCKEAYEPKGTQSERQMTNLLRAGRRDGLISTHTALAIFTCPDNGSGRHVEHAANEDRYKQNFTPCYIKARLRPENDQRTYQQ